METKLRTLKAERIALSTADDELGAKELQKKINAKQKEYKNFCKKTGLTPQTERATVEWYRRISVKGLQDNEDSAIIKQARETMLSQIKSGKLPLKLNIGNQDKHIVTSKTYNATEKKSYIIGDLEKAQSLVNQYYGKGTLKLTSQGKWTNKEFVIIDKDMGYVYNAEKNIFELTNRFSIHYGKKGTHIVPRKRLEDET